MKLSEENIREKDFHDNLHGEGEHLKTDSIKP